MNEISFAGKLHFAKNIDNLSPELKAEVKTTLQKWLSMERIQKAIPEDVYVSASNSKKQERIYINIKDENNTKYGIDLSKNGKNTYLWEGLLVYIFGRYNTEPINLLRELREGHKYVLNRAVEILKEKFPLK